MADPDSYKTITALSEGEYKEKGSKFLAFAAPVKSTDKAMRFIDRLKQQHHSARHICFAYSIGPDRKEHRINDAGEPSGTAGQPIYGQILSAGLTNIIIVVVRYYGGTKLGASGLRNAYKIAAQQAVLNAKITNDYVKDVYSIAFRYPDMSIVMRLLEDIEATVIRQEYTEACEMDVAIRKKYIDRFKAGLQHIQDVNINYISTLQ